MNQSISLGIAFAAGLVSFLSPCVLPLIPGYISFVSGISIEEMKEETQGRAIGRRVFLNSCFFVLGFSTVFVLLGASATGIGKFLLARLDFFNKIAGAIIILFGLHVLGILKWNLLLREKRFEVRKKPLGWLGSLVVGATFAFGWTPCIGPVLAGILSYASTQETIRQGMLLLAFYSLGLGVPFLLTALGIQRFFHFFGKIKRWLRALEMGSGVLLILIGILIFTNRLTMLAGRLSFLNLFSL